MKDGIGNTGTSKTTFEVVCAIVRFCNCIARINVGAELTSGFVVGFTPHLCVTVV